MGRITFPKGFIWAFAMAAFQNEGAVNEDGRGESIWDRYSHTPGKIANGDTADVTCDYYHRYKEDIGTMKDIGINLNRFSTAWTRILPEGKGRVNQKGLDFYDRVVDELLKNGIEPMCVLDHWDLPQALQDLGGWANRDIAGWFGDYSEIVFNALGDRIKKWVTHIEPWVISISGHGMGTNAPGIKDYSVALQVSHHLNLAHARAIEVYRQKFAAQKGIIGISLNLGPIYPASDSAEDREAAVEADGLQNRWFLDPVLKGEYPDDILEMYARKFGAPVISAGDMDFLKRNIMDFLGVNYYFRNIVKKVRNADSPDFEWVFPEGLPYTNIPWEIYPQGLYELLMRIDKDYGHPKMYLTENGCSFKDKMVGSMIEDDDRIQFLKDHIYQLHRAMADGADVGGYTCWTLMDNFEWTKGFTQKFGLLHTDFKTLKRTWKKSAYWYRDVINQNGFDYNEDQ